MSMCRAQFGYLSKRVRGPLCNLICNGFAEEKISIRLDEIREIVLLTPPPEPEEAGLAQSFAAKPASHLQSCQSTPPSQPEQPRTTALRLIGRISLATSF